MSCWLSSLTTNEESWGPKFEGSRTFAPVGGSHESKESGRDGEKPVVSGPAVSHEPVDNDRKREENSVEYRLLRERGISTRDEQ